MKANRGPEKPPAQSVPPAAPEPSEITLPNGMTVPVPTGRVTLSCRRGLKTVNGLKVGLVPVELDASDWSAAQWQSALSDPFLKVTRAA